MELTKLNLFDELQIGKPFNNQLEEALEVFLETGYMYGCIAEYDRAESCFDGVLAICPDHIGGLLGLGNVLLMKGDLNKSENVYTRVLEISPDDPAALAFLGELYLCTDRILEGKKLLEKVWWENPNSKVGDWAKSLLQLTEEFCREN